MVKRKVLFCATIDLHFKAFHLPYLKWFKEQGWEVHVAAKGDLELPFVDKKFNIPFERSPLKRKNIIAYKDLKSIIESNHYHIIHCHTPMGGVISRLAARKMRNNGTKVLYTAHGFHFCKGAPIKNWLLYYPIEKFLATITDCLITINQEDFQLAKKAFHAKMIKHVNGVGVNTEIFSPVKQFHKSVLKAEHGYNSEEFLLFYAAEFNHNKNQQFLIRAIDLIKEKVPNIKLLLAGDGLLLNECKELASKLGIIDRIDFLGFRNDIDLLLKMSDLAVASSLREGLPVNILEAMSCGLPVIATNNRGHRELIRDEENGWLIHPDNVQEIATKIIVLAQNQHLLKRYGSNSRKIIIQDFGIEKILSQKSQIYQSFMNEVEDLKWAIH